MQEVATIDKVSNAAEAGADGVATELRVRTALGNLVAGESIAINGVCLTVCEFGSDWFSVQAMGSTLARTAIGEWKAGHKVNLERAMSADSRFGGHIVQGHVDGVGHVVGRESQGGAVLLDIECPAEFMEPLVMHGSVAVDGVSLTINDLPKAGMFQVALIEFTLTHTTLSSLRLGSRVHLEGDIIGKYVQRAMQPYLKGLGR